mmetsp:Transcript_12536/g.53722  ORF Transcript_12536/g.53722 Transcript_12536/m.53722 type:complete len:218 (+) Transcript_12536:27-680(+)
MMTDDVFRRSTDDYFRRTLPDYRGDYSRPGAVNAPTTATSASAHRDRIANHAVSSRSVGAASRLVTSKRTLHPKSTLHASAFGCLAVHRTVGQCMLVSPQTPNVTPITRPTSVHRDQNDSRLCLVWSVGADDDDDEDEDAGVSEAELAAAAEAEAKAKAAKKLDVQTQALTRVLDCEATFPEFAEALARCADVAIVGDERSLSLAEKLDAFFGELST